MGRESRRKKPTAAEQAATWRGLARTALDLASNFAELSEQFEKHSVLGIPASREERELAATMRAQLAALRAKHEGELK